MSTKKRQAQPKTSSLKGYAAAWWEMEIIGATAQRLKKDLGTRTQVAVSFFFMNQQGIQTEMFYFSSLICSDVLKA